MAKNLKSRKEKSTFSWGTDPNVKKVVYAGFWRRLLAYIIDVCLLTCAFLIVGFLITIIDLFISGYPNTDFNGILFKITLLLIGWLYYAFMESSDKQATLGKMALGLKVVDEEGKQISFWRATGRFWAKYLSSLILYIGFLMILWTEKKQGLHDELASCLVIKAE
ncbi:RDD family protein [Candidatus Woesearchaeota archaeon]|nr:RDD family protein [Candidatus Woesearchaeota archaeon]